MPLYSLALLLLAACWLSPAEVQERLDSWEPLPDTDIDDTDDTDTDDTDTDDTDTDTDDTDTDTEDTDVPCPEIDLGSATGAQVATGTNAGATDDLLGTCTEGTGGRDVAFAWSAPTSSCYAIDTLQSTYDTVLYLLEGPTCGGRELVCEDDFTETIEQSEVRWFAGTAQPFTVVLDAFDAAATGDYALSLRAVSEPFSETGNLGSATGSSVLSATTVGADSTLDPWPCPYASGADVFYRWQAPSTGTFTFTVNAGFDSVLAVLQRCYDFALTCADANEGTGTEQLSLTLVKGDVIFVRIAGYDDALFPPEQGAFTLSIE